MKHSLTIGLSLAALVPLTACASDDGSRATYDPNMLGSGAPTGGVSPSATASNGDALPPGTAPGASVADPDGTAPASSVPAPGAGGAGSDPEGQPPEPVTDVVLPEITPTEDCSVPDPGQAPLRRLTRFEYNNTVRDLLGDTTNPGNQLPAETTGGTQYGNDANAQNVASVLAEQYGAVADDIASRALADVTSDPRFQCMTTVTADTETTCAQSIIESFGADAYRRPLEAADVDNLVALQAELRANGTFEESIHGLVEAILQSPDFLYRVETGVEDPGTGLRRPTGREMANRLSYFLWGSMPDDTLAAAADAGELDTPEGVRLHAARMVDDLDRARPVLRYFFDHLLPTNTVTELARDPAQYPTYSNAIGALMVRETREFLEHEIYEGSGTYTGVLTAPYVMVNEELADYYGIPGVVGEEFRRVEVDPETHQRMGLLSQGALLAGTTISNFTNPVKRGGFIVREILCQHIELPADQALLDQVTPPEPFEEGTEGRETGRLRYEQHSEEPVCATCHAILDPPGFALENFDAVGLWRDQENGVTIDATGDIALIGGTFDGPFELARRIASNKLAYTCFASNWVEFAMGRAVERAEPADACLNQQALMDFAESGFNIKELIVGLTQTDAFLYLPNQEQL